MGHDPTTLLPDQLRQMAQGVAIAVADTLRGDVSRCGRSCYTIKEVADRAGMSETAVRRDVAAGLLRVVRPGGRAGASVLAADELTYLEGRKGPGAPACEGLSPVVTQRRRTAAIVSHIMRRSDGKTVHRA
jgi:hypothetical protein